MKRNMHVLAFSLALLFTAAWSPSAQEIKDQPVLGRTDPAMFKDAPAGVGAYGSKPPLGVGTASDDCEFMQQAVARLDDADQGLLREVYVVGGTTKEIAARLGWHRQRVPERLVGVGNRLMGHMNDIAAGC